MTPTNEPQAQGVEELIVDSAVEYACSSKLSTNGGAMWCMEIEAFKAGAKWALEYFRVENPQVMRAIRALKNNEAESERWKTLTPEQRAAEDDARESMARRWK